MHSAILRTLAYADIFDYPLTLKELRHWLIGSPSSQLPQISQLPQVNYSLCYYFLKDRTHIVKLRGPRHRWSTSKLRLAQKAGKWLSCIPTIKLVAITGALAMKNSDEHDDIDLMIVTSPHRLWLTRLIVTLLTEVLGIRRRPSRYTLDPNRYPNKICLNLWLDETALSVPVSQRNLYTAHEVAQIKPIFDRSHTYHHFLASNSWLNDYLPNIKIPQRISRQLVTSNYSLVTLFEYLAFKLQYLYMKRRITREKVSTHFAFFHPRNTSRWVMREYNKRLKMLGLK